MSGGGGGGTSTQITDVPDWAKPYAKEALGKASALTDIKKNPYQAYGGDRSAQFTPLQQQAYQGAAGMQAGPAAFQSQVGQYMSPYMQNIVNAQQKGAQREADVQGQVRGAQAARSGAFGGGRQAIMQSEAARNLASQKSDIQGRGYKLLTIMLLGNTTKVLAKIWLLISYKINMVVSSSSKYRM